LRKGVEQTFAKRSRWWIAPSPPLFVWDSGERARPYRGSTTLDDWWSRDYCTSSTQKGRGKDYMASEWSSLSASLERRRQKRRVIIFLSFDTKIHTFACAVRSHWGIGLVSLLSVGTKRNKHNSQKFPDRPNMISEGSRHSWRSLLPTGLFWRIWQL